MWNPNDPFISGFKRELLRWNKQMSLVSRRDTGNVLDNLLYQSSAGFETFLGFVDNFVGNSQNQEPPVAGDKPVDNSEYNILYFDLGSGGGLPGVVWAYRLRTLSSSCRSYLVEPREKRAWFLERVLRSSFFAGRFTDEASDISSVCVIPDRWGSLNLGKIEISGPQNILISLKALHLDDSSVVGGLFSSISQIPASGRLVIARFYPGGQRNDADLVQSLGFPAVGSSLPDFPQAVFLGSRVLSIPAAGFLPASLVVSHYNF